MKKYLVLAVVLAFCTTLRAADVQLVKPSAPDWKGWTVTHLAPPFPGITGNLDIKVDPASPSGFLLTVNAGYTGDTGAHYLAIACDMPPDTLFYSLKLRFRTSDYGSIIVRIYDATGQFHQQRQRVKPTDGWQELEIKNLNGWETRGGANDRRWHDPVKSIWILFPCPWLRDKSKMAGSVVFSDIIMTGE